MRLPDTPQNEATRQALIQAAVQVFARDGFQIARIRDIAEAAQVNLSAINYHFGSKQGLYQAVLSYVATQIIERRPLLPEDTAALPPEARFQMLVGNMLRRFVDAESPSLMAQFLVREMANPTPALEHIIETVSKPQFAIIACLIAELLGPAATPQRIRDCTLSLLGQALFYLFGRPLVSHMFADLYSEASIEHLAQHIARFSLAGIQAYHQAQGANAQSDTVADPAAQTPGETP